MASISCTTLRRRLGVLAVAGAVVVTALTAATAGAWTPAQVRPRRAADLPDTADWGRPPEQQPMRGRGRGGRCARPLR